MSKHSLSTEQENFLCVPRGLSKSPSAVPKGGGGEFRRTEKHVVDFENQRRQPKKECQTTAIRKGLMVTMNAI